MSLIDDFTPLQKQALADLLKNDFRQFIKFAFKIRSGGNFAFQPHHDIIIDTLQKVIDGDITRLILAIPPRHSKCLVKGEKVLTTEGYKNIENVTTADSVYSHIDGIIAEQKVLATEAFSKNTVIVTTRSGRSLNLSYDHPVLTQRGWVNAEELTKEHFIVRLNTVLDTNQRIDSSELDFITLMLFEGGTSFTNGKNLRFTNFDPEVVTIFKNACSTLGIKIKEYREGHFSCLGGKYSKGTELIRKWGMEGKKAIEKELPKQFYVLPLDQKYRFLSLMYATDGFISKANKSLGITLGSEKLAKDISLFLDTLGVPSNYSSQCNGFAGSYTTVVSRSFAEKLVPKLNLLQKQVTWDSLETTKSFSNTFGYPYDVFKGITGKCKKATPIISPKHKEQVVTEQTFNRIVNEIDKSKLVFKKEDFIYDQVSSIKCTFVKTVYHLDIDSNIYDNKNFIGNGLVVHNSELVSVMLPAYSFVKNKRSEVIQTTCADSLCREMSTGVRDILFSQEFQDLFGFSLRKDMSSLNDWGIQDGGKAHFVPTGGSVIGKGAGTLADGFSGLMVIDDATKAEDAYSQQKRTSINNRYTNTLLSRLANRKKTPVVIIQQRLEICDLFKPIELRETLK